MDIFIALIPNETIHQPSSSRHSFDTQTGSRPVSSSSEVETDRIHRSQSRDSLSPTSAIPYHVIHGFDRDFICENITESDTIRDSSSNSGFSHQEESKIFEASAKVSTSFQAPFRDVTLMLYKHNFSGDFRIYCRENGSSTQENESFYISKSQHELVPIYGYEHTDRNRIYLRVIAPQHESYTGPSSAPGIVGIWEFDTQNELFDFQAKLLGDNVLLDISNVRIIKFATPGIPMFIRQIDSPRLQLWLEQKCQDTRLNHKMSSVRMEGEPLRGPLKASVEARCARLILFFGRAEGYLQCYITEDTEMRRTSPVEVRISARKYSGNDYFRSRKGVRCQIKEHKHLAAAIGLMQRDSNVDEETRSVRYRYLDIQFETSHSLESFNDVWQKLVAIRRKERTRIKAIQEEMDRATFTGRIARRII